MSDKELEILENDIPKLAQKAVTKAYKKVLEDGESVLEVIDSKIYEVFPDGSKKLIKDVAKDIVIRDKKIVING